jgi:hypothetical protein
MHLDPLGIASLSALFRAVTNFLVVNVKIAYTKHARRKRTPTKPGNQQSLMTKAPNGSEAA